MKSAKGVWYRCSLSRPEQSMQATWLQIGIPLPQQQSLRMGESSGSIRSLVCLLKPRGL